MITPEYFRWRPDLLQRDIPSQNRNCYLKSHGCSQYNSCNPLYLFPFDAEEEQLRLLSVEKEGVVDKRRNTHDSKTNGKPCSSDI
jgi:hypothetical protein